MVGRVCVCRSSTRIRLLVMDEMGLKSRGHGVGRRHPDESEQIIFDLSQNLILTYP